LEIGFDIIIYLISTSLVWNLIPERQPQARAESTAAKLTPRYDLGGRSEPVGVNEKTGGGTSSAEEFVLGSRRTQRRSESSSQMQVLSG
jgi:hypothetical protein